MKKLMSKSKIPSLIKRARESRGLSQRALAKEMSVTNSYISLIESGDRFPSLEFLSSFAERFSLPVLMFFEEALPAAKTAEEKEIRKQLRNIFTHYDRLLHAKTKTQTKSGK